MPSDTRERARGSLLRAPGREIELQPVRLREGHSCLGNGAVELPRSILRPHPACAQVAKRERQQRIPRTRRHRTHLANSDRPLDPSCPGSNCGISATVRVQHRERVGGPRLAVNRHQHAAAARQHMKDPAVVRLKSDPPHRAGNARLRQPLIAALQCGDERARAPSRARDRGPRATAARRACAR